MAVTYSVTEDSALVSRFNIPAYVYDDYVNHLKTQPPPTS